MKRITLILFIALSILACSQNAIEMQTPENANEQFEAFILKKKFLPEAYYPGIEYEHLRPVYSEKVNKAAKGFQIISETELPTNKMYLEEIRLGLQQFESIYIQIDTEDKERIALYFEELMDIVELESSNGQLNTFIYGYDPTQLFNSNYKQN